MLRSSVWLFTLFYVFHGHSHKQTVSTAAFPVNNTNQPTNQPDSSEKLVSFWSWGQHLQYMVRNSFYGSSLWKQQMSVASPDWWWPTV